MDIMMPEMDGKEAIQQVRALEEAGGVLSNRGVKIVMTTAGTGLREVMQSFQELCDAYQFKPIDTVKLQGELRSFELVQ
jgi:two-component system chemotaxis response regulator CheY